MQSIEQAQEAPERIWVDEYGFTAESEGVEYIRADISPSTPVYGVGAEPVETFQWPEPKFVPMGDSGQSLNPQRVQSLRDFIKIEMTLGEQLKLFKALHLAEYLTNPEAEARLRERVAELEEKLDDALRGPWPEWANEIRKCLEGYGVDPGDEWDLPEQFEEWIAGVVENETRRAEAAEARLAQAEGGPAVTEAWQPIESAPLDGTTVDLWHEDFGRHTDHYWGVPSHECGEAGSFCDSDWHSISEGWVDGTFNSLSDEPQGFTHWMPHPKPPAALHPQSAAGEEGK